MTDPFRKIIADNTTAPELSSLADRLADLKNRLAEAEEITNRIRGDMEATEAELFDALENAGIRQIRTERGLFSQNDLAWAQVKDEELAKAWADTQMPELITLNRARLSKVVRDILKGELSIPMPPGVDFTTSRKITWRRQ